MRGWIGLPAAGVLPLLGGICPAGAENVTTNATPTGVHTGDMVTLSGMVPGTRTTAVYLCVTGPDPDFRGSRRGTRS
jgi:hypothetical protein